MQRHYDTKAPSEALSLPICEAKRARAQGASYPLKKFHNTVKRKLLNHFHRGPALLDVCCGRGGDLLKWKALCDEEKTGLRQVTAMDFSSNEIDEARRRWAASGAGTSVLHVSFIVADAAERWPTEARSAAFDTVSCMFALHYFFGSQCAATQFFSQVAAALKPNGVFIGVVPNGTHISDMGTVRQGALSLTNSWRGDAPDYGGAYTMALDDSVVDGAGSREFAVVESSLRAAAEAAGLLPETDDALFPQGVLKKNTGRVMKPFDPPFLGSVGHTMASTLYAAFAFRKPT